MRYGNAHLSFFKHILHTVQACRGSGRGLVVRVLDSGLYVHGFDPHTGHGSILKLRQFHLLQFASVCSAANEYQHCWEGTCDGLAPVQERLYNCTLIACAK